MKLVELEILVKGCAKSSYETRRFLQKKVFFPSDILPPSVFVKQPLKLNFIKDLLKAAI